MAAAEEREQEQELQHIRKVVCQLLETQPRGRPAERLYDCHLSDGNVSQWVRAKSVEVLKADKIIVERRGRQESALEADFGATAAYCIIRKPPKQEYGTLSCRPMEPGRPRKEPPKVLIPEKPKEIGAPPVAVEAPKPPEFGPGDYVMTDYGLARVQQLTGEKETIVSLAKPASIGDKTYRMIRLGNERIRLLRKAPPSAPPVEPPTPPEVPKIPEPKLPELERVEEARKRAIGQLKLTSF